MYSCVHTYACTRRERERQREREKEKRLRERECVRERDIYILYTYTHRETEEGERKRETERERERARERESERAREKRERVIFIIAPDGICRYFRILRTWPQAGASLDSKAERPNPFGKWLPDKAASLASEQFFLGSFFRV